MKCQGPQRGVSLVELMVATTLGLLLALAITSLHARVLQFGGDAGRAAEAQDTLRIALALLEYELGHAGHWAVAGDATAIAGRRDDPVPLVVAVAGDCGPDWAIDLDRPFEAFPGPWPLGCAPFGGEPARGDVLVMRRADNNTGTPDAGVLQLYLDPWGGRLLVSGESPGPGEEVRDLVARAYYVSPRSTGDASRPALRRKTLQRGPRVIDEELVAGIALLEILVGEDLDSPGTPGHGAPNRFVAPGALAGTPLAARIRLTSDGPLPLTATRTVPLRNVTPP